MTLAVTTKADPKAVAVARAVYDAVLPEKVILFGSRARGDHRADSDIDLLIISDDMSRDIRMKAQKVALEASLRVYGIRDHKDYLGADRYGCLETSTRNVGTASITWQPKPRETEWI